MDLKDHWDGVYKTKEPHQVSWTQAVPEISLKFLSKFSLPKSAKIIDVGGGDSKLVDHLLDLGYTDITVLDISEQALQRAKRRLGVRSNQINWVVSNVVDFKPEYNFAWWHDRATFHFLTEKSEIEKYLSLAKSCTSQFITIGTFSDEGPDKCSGIPVQQYTEQELTDTVSNGFKKLECFKTNHTSPFNTIQNFLFCSFQKKREK